MWNAALIRIMYSYHALINALSVHMIHINVSTLFYTHIEHSPTKTTYIRYYMETHHTHIDSCIHANRTTFKVAEWDGIIFN